MEEISPGGQPAERTETPQSSVPPAQAVAPIAQTVAPVQETRAKEEPAEKKESPGRAYLKAIIIMMVVFLGVPVIGFFVLFPFLLSLMAANPFMFTLLPFAFLAYFGVAAYWFFKKGMFWRMVNASTRFGMGWSKKVMNNVDPELKKDMMKKPLLFNFL